MPKFAVGIVPVKFSAFRLVRPYPSPTSVAALTKRAVTIPVLRAFVFVLCAMTVVATRLDTVIAPLDRNTVLSPLTRSIS